MDIVTCQVHPVLVKRVQCTVSFSPPVNGPKDPWTCVLLGPMKGGQSVECQGKIFGNVACQLENGSFECRLNIL